MHPLYWPLIENHNVSYEVSYGILNNRYALPTRQLPLPRKKSVSVAIVDRSSLFERCWDTQYPASHCIREVGKAYDYEGKGGISGATRSHFCLSRRHKPTMLAMPTPMTAPLLERLNTPMSALQSSSDTAMWRPQSTRE